MKKSLNEIAQYEVAISKKYGPEAVDHPKKYWNSEKEEDYKQQIKELYEKEKKVQEKSEKIEVDGIFISKKLLTKNDTRVCPVCHTYSFELRDDVYMTKFDCCFKCYIQWVEGREHRWESGWRPDLKEK
jgi:PHD/YefM family antitoxin component YafN of YafNO toxin-antitoxin module